MTRPAAHPPPPPDDLDAALRRVRQSGGRITPAKRALVELIFASPDALTADELVERIGDHDRSVVYRNLHQLEHLGIAEHIHLGHGQAVYRAAGRSTVLVLCNGCGSTRELPRTEVQAFDDAVRERTGISLDLTHFPLTGTCDGCRSGAAAADDLDEVPRP